MQTTTQRYVPKSDAKIQTNHSTVLIYRLFNSCHQNKSPLLLTDGAPQCLMPAVL